MDGATCQWAHRAVRVPALFMGVYRPLVGGLWLFVSGEQDGAREAPYNCLSTCRRNCSMLPAT